MISREVFNELETDLNIGRLKVDEEEIANNQSSRNPYSKSAEPHYHTYQTHLEQIRERILLQIQSEPHELKIKPPKLPESTLLLLHSN